MRAARLPGGPALADEVEDGRDGGWAGGRPGDGMVAPVGWGVLWGVLWGASGASSESGAAGRVHLLMRIRRQALMWPFSSCVFGSAS